MVPCSPDPPRYDCSPRQMSFIEDMRSQLLGGKRVLGNFQIRWSQFRTRLRTIWLMEYPGLAWFRVSIIPLTPADALLARVGIRKRSASIGPYPLGKQLPGRRHPVKAASREAGARTAPALTEWRWSDLLGFKLARPTRRLTAPTLAFYPSSIRCRRHCA